MSLSFATGTVLPILVITIMFGLGLGLTRADFARVFYSPKPVLIGLLCQSLILPAVAFLLCYLARLDSALAIGFILLAASPGGPSANFFSHLAKGDVALNLTLTAVNSVTGMFILPALVYLACVLFLDDGVAIGIQTKKLIEVLFLVCVPTVIGMLVRHRAPELALKLAKPVKLLSIFALLFVVVLTFVAEREMIAKSYSMVGLAMIVFNLASLSIGYYLPRMLQLPERQAIAIAFETGVHNSSLAIYVAIQVLGQTQYALPALAYSLSMYLMAGLFLMFLRRSTSTT